MKTNINYYQADDCYLSDESSIILDKLQNLRLSTEGKRSRKVPMEALDDKL